MHAREQVGFSRLIRRGWFVAVVVGMAGSGAFGQVRARGQDDNQKNGGVPAQGPRRMSGLGGVRSEAPRPLKGINPPKMSLPGPSSNIRGTRAGLPGKISGLGGSPASFPQTQPLGPSRRDPRFTQPEFRPMSVGPWPGVTSEQPRPTTPVTTPPRGERPFVPVVVPDRGRTPVIVLPDQRFVTVDGSGLTVDARYQGDRFRLGVHLGSHPELIAFPVHPGYGFGGFYRPRFYGNAGWWSGDYSSCTSCNSYISGGYMSVDPQLVEQPAAPQPMTEAAPANDKEAGDFHLQSGEAKKAIRSYRTWLKANPGDAETMRSLGLALIEDGQTKEGVAMLALAYKTDPGLAIHPPSVEMYAGGAKEWRENLRRVSVYANSTGGSSAWLAVAVFMQAEGRNETARAMIDRASAAGLEPAVVAGMRAALMD